MATEKDIKEVIKEVVTTIYLNDNSDYLGALYRVIEVLDPDLYIVLAEDERKAFKLVADDEIDD